MSDKIDLNTLAQIQDHLFKISMAAPCVKASASNPFAARSFTLADARSHANMALQALQRLIKAEAGEGKAMVGMVPEWLFESNVTPEEYADYVHGAKLNGLKPFSFEMYCGIIREKKKADGQNG